LLKNLVFRHAETPKSYGDQLHWSTAKKKGWLLLEKMFALCLIRKRRKDEQQLEHDGKHNEEDDQGDDREQGGDQGKGREGISDKCLSGTEEDQLTNCGKDSL
jgi:hypothetical protein